jgi:hypothetical protein
MNNQEIMHAADILEDLIGNNFHDAIATAVRDNWSKDDNWFPSDEDIHKIKRELAKYLIHMTK